MVLFTVYHHDALRAGTNFRDCGQNPFKSVDTLKAHILLFYIAILCYCVTHFSIFAKQNLDFVFNFAS